MSHCRATSSACASSSGRSPHVPGARTSDHRPIHPDTGSPRSGRRHLGSRRMLGRRCTTGRFGDGVKSAGSQRVGSGSSPRGRSGSARMRTTSRIASTVSFVTMPAATSSRTASRTLCGPSAVAAARSAVNDAPCERSTSRTARALSESSDSAIGWRSQSRPVPRSKKRMRPIACEGATPTSSTRGSAAQTSAPDAARRASECGS